VGADPCRPVPVHLAESGPARPHRGFGLWSGPALQRDALTLANDVLDGHRKNVPPVPGPQEDECVISRALFPAYTWDSWLIGGSYPVRSLSEQRKLR
jgi:hypothetical protein